jgi:hypothetical protein
MPQPVLKLDESSVFTVESEPAQVTTALERCGMVRRSTWAEVQQLNVPASVRVDLKQVLCAAQPDPSALLLAAAQDAGLNAEEGLKRAVGIDLCYCAGHLADDLIDGDATYLEKPATSGPVLQFLLQALAQSTLAESGISKLSLSRAQRRLAEATGPQALEFEPTFWTVARYQRLGEAILGHQWAAYLSLLWDGTSLQAEATRVGIALGIAAHVAADRASQSSRLMRLAGPERALVLRWGRDAAAELAGMRLLVSVQALTELGGGLEGAQ